MGRREACRLEVRRRGGGSLGGRVVGLGSRDGRGVVLGAWLFCGDRWGACRLGLAFFTNHQSWMVDRHVEALDLLDHQPCSYFAEP